MKFLTKEDLYKYREGYHLTAGRLKEALKDVPDDAMVLVERVEDVYFEKHGWSVYPIDGEWYYDAIKFNEELDQIDESGDEEDKEWRKDKQKYTEEQIQMSKDQFVPAWDATNYHKDKEIFLIHMHY